MRLGLNEKSTSVTSTCSTRDQSTSADARAAPGPGVVGGSGWEVQPAKPRLAAARMSERRGTLFTHPPLVAARNREHASDLADHFRGPPFLCAVAQVSPSQSISSAFRVCGGYSMTRGAV